jgi:hypothetical protein
MFLLVFDLFQIVFPSIAYDSDFVEIRMDDSRKGTTIAMGRGDEKSESSLVHGVCSKIIHFNSSHDFN